MAIISHKYKFIFKKTFKTAGTALEVNLAPLCGPDDVVTPIFPEEPGHVARNFIVKSDGEGDDEKFFNHMGMQLIRKLIGPEQFSTYYKFCVEREPVDKCLSYFAMLRHSPHHQRENAPQTWDEYVEQGNFPVEYARYTTAQGRLLVDRVLRYENLESELREVLLALGVNWTGLTSRAKSGFRKDGVPRRDEVTSDAVDIIYEAFKHPVSLYA